MDNRRTDDGYLSYKLTIEPSAQGELNIHCFTFFPYKSIRDQIWPCRKIGQGQPRVITWANLVVLKHPMMHIKFQGHRPFGSREEDFLRFLPYMGMAAILVMWPGPFEQTYNPPHHRSFIWNLTLIGLVVSEKKMFNPSHVVRDLSRVRQYPPWLLFTAFVNSMWYPRYNPQTTRKQWRTRDRRFHWLWFSDLKIIFMM